MSSARCIYLKLSSVDLENHLRYGPLPLPCFVCAAFSNRIKIQRTNRFIKSCFSPCCTRRPLLLLPRDTARGFVSPSSFQRGQLLARTVGATKATLPCCLCELLPSWLQSTAPVRRGQVGVS